jgi:hypothetical protein
MGISDLALGAPSGLFSTQDYNEAQRKKSKLVCLKEREEAAERNRQLREREGVVCGCGVKYHPILDVDHRRTGQHTAFLRETEGVVCECGIKYHPVMEKYVHSFHAAHRAYEDTRIPCDCGATVQRKRLSQHVTSKTHTRLLRRRLEMERLKAEVPCIEV